MLSHSLSLPAGIGKPARRFSPVSVRPPEVDRCHHNSGTLKQPKRPHKQGALIARSNRRKRPRSQLARNIPQRFATVSDALITAHSLTASWLTNRLASKN